MCDLSHYFEDFSEQDPTTGQHPDKASKAPGPPPAKRVASPVLALEEDQSPTGTQAALPVFAGTSERRP